MPYVIRYISENGLRAPSGSYYKGNAITDNIQEARIYLKEPKPIKGAEMVEVKIVEV